MALAGEIGPERVDRGRLADAGRAGDSDPRRLPGFCDELLHQPVCGLLMIGALALDQRDRARKARALAGAELARKNLGGFRTEFRSGILILSVQKHSRHNAADDW